MKWTSTEAYVGLIASIFGGCVFVYKKIIKPAWRIFRQIKRYADLLEKMEVNEKKLASLVNLSDSSFIEFSANGSCISVNGATLEIFGTEDSHNMFGYGWCNFIVEISRQQARAEWKEMVKTDSRIERALTLVHPKTGNEKRVIFLAEISKNNKDEVINIIGKFKVI